VKLSFARAKGRNYRQLPARARSREKPSPADIVYSKSRLFPCLHVSGEMLFSARQYQPKGPKVTWVRLRALAAG
jgi:hypothetical protein